MILLRDYQHNADKEIDDAWAAGHKNVLYTLPTGSGKTVLFAYKISKHIGYSCAIAHRSELVTQISLALASFGVRHRVIASDATIKFITQEHFKQFGNVFVDQNAHAAVASIDTLIRRKKALASWRAQVTLWVLDEGHHAVKTNKWGQVATLHILENNKLVKVEGIFPNAKGLLVTATPLRADGKGLGRHHDGIVDVLLQGPDMRWMIEQGYLTPYRIFVPPSDLDLDSIKIGATGDYSHQGMKKAAQKSHIVGDVVDHYLRIAQGKLGITFATDVETSQNIANQYMDAGVPVAAVCAKTPEHVRSEAVNRLRNKTLHQLTNVDLFGEGFDLPAIEVVSMARPTQSYGLFVQQFGRGLRPVYAPGYDLTTQAGRLAAIANGPKPFGIIIDHVGNVIRHGLPDAPRVWSLDRRQKRAQKVGDPNAVPITTCLRPEPPCFTAYEATLKACPVCGFVPVPSSRNGPEFVDGVLSELNEETLARMRGEIAEATKSPTEIQQEMIDLGHDPIVAVGRRNRQREKLEALDKLKDAMCWWAGVQKSLGRDKTEAQQRFYWKFKIDVGSAQMLKRADAVKLEMKIREDMTL